MPLEDYRKFRTNILQSDTLRKECDSIITKQDLRLLVKDSIIGVRDNKLVLKDSIIYQKDITIKELSKEEPKKGFFTKEFWIGIVTGIVGTIALLK